MVAFLLLPIPIWCGKCYGGSLFDLHVDGIIRFILYCIRDYYRFLLELYLILGEFLLLIFMYFFELLFVISTMFCLWDCSICMVNWLLYSQVYIFEQYYSLLHVLSAVLQSSLIIVMLILGNFLFFSYWNVEMYVVNTKSSTDLKMVYVVDLSLFQ
jgi:hypothetical protein